MSKEFCKMSLGLVLGLGTCLGGLGLASGAEAQCTVPPSCESLGYGQKATDCANRPVLKCPFDTAKVYCGVFVDEEGKAVAEIGDVLYSDMTVGTWENLIPGKTPIGVVVDAKNRKAIGLSYLDKSFISSSLIEIPNNAPLNVTDNAKNDFEGKDNTKKLLAYIGDNLAYYPALQACQNYATAGTKSGDWYLPAGGEFISIKDVYKLSKISPFSCSIYRDENVCREIRVNCESRCGTDESCKKKCYNDSTKCYDICEDIRLNYIETNFWTSSLSYDRGSFGDPLGTTYCIVYEYSQYCHKGNTNSLSVTCMINF